MSTARTSETLAHVQLFANLDPDVVRRLDTQCSWRRVSAKQVIVDYLQEDDSVLFVTSGAVRVQLDAGPEHNVIFRDLEAGHFFGEVAAIDGRPRSASVIALTDATLARMPSATFLSAIFGHPPLCLSVMRLLTDRIRSLSGRIEEFSSLPVRHRIYAELLRLSRPDRGDGAGAIISPPPYHAEIAARVSTRRETVTRELKGLERAGLLERRRGALVLTDPPKLSALIEQARDAAAERQGEHAPA